MPVVLLIVTGAVTGWLATRLMRLQTDLPTVMFIGIAGALAGGLGLRFIATSAHWLAGMGAATAGAMLLIWLWLRYRE